MFVKWLGVGMSAAIPAAILVIGIGLTILVGWIHRFFTQYTITTKRLNIRSGILSKTESSTNVDRIQNITVHQSPVDRIMKVGSIGFDTAERRRPPTSSASSASTDRRICGSGSCTRGTPRRRAASTTDRAASR